ncbi:MAG: hypothetical protein NZO16_07045, partial [Deltaproteobacteria bacterium]|nr:hypothetical protein [Deltaproteobacteria bacterium]
VFILNEIAAGTFYHKLSSGRIIKIYLPKVIGILESRLKGAKINQARLDSSTILQDARLYTTQKILEDFNSPGRTEGQENEEGGSDFEPQAGENTISYRLPVRNWGFKVLGYEYKVPYRLRHPELVFKRFTSFLQKTGNSIAERNLQLPTSLPSFLMPGRANENEFKDPRLEPARTIREIRQSGILLLAGHGGPVDTTDKTHPVFGLLSYLVPNSLSERDRRYVSCMLAHYLYYHIHERLAFSSFNNLVRTCRDRNDLVVQLDSGRIQSYVCLEEIGYDAAGQPRYGQPIFVADVSLDSLQGHYKSLIFGTSCGSKVPISNVQENVFKNPVVSFSNFRNLSSIDIIYPTCWTEYGPYGCSSDNSFILDHILVRDLAGVTYFSAQAPQFLENPPSYQSPPLWTNDSYHPHGLAGRVTACFSSEIDIVPNFASLLINNLEIFRFDFRNIVSRNFWHDSCPNVRDYFQAYAVAGVPHKGFLHGLEINLPEPQFPIKPHFNYVLYSPEDSIKYRSSYAATNYYYDVTVSPGVKISTRLPGAINRPIRRHDLRNFLTRLARHPHLLERGVQNVSTVFAVRPTDVRVNPRALRVEIDFDLPVSAINITDFKILLSEKMETTINLGNRQYADFSPFVLRTAPYLINSGKTLVLEFHPEAIQIMGKNHWLLPFPDFKQKYPKAGLDMAKSQYDWRYFMEVHIVGDRLAGNSTVFRTRLTLNEHHHRNFWVWPLQDPSAFPDHLVSPDFKKHAMLRSAPYMVGLGQIFDTSFEPDFVYDPVFWKFHGVQRNNALVLRIPLEPKVVTCQLRVRNVCKNIKKRRGGRASPEGSQEGGDDGECIVTLCGDLPEESLCYSGYVDHDAGQDLTRDCELGAATCCPNVEIANCGDQLTCETRTSFQSEEELDMFKQHCEQNGGKFFKHCQIVNWEGVCCSETNGVCQGSVTEGCCAGEDGGTSEFKIGPEEEGTQCNGVTQSAQ